MNQSGTLSKFTEAASTKSVNAAEALSQFIEQILEHPGLISKALLELYASFANPFRLNGSHGGDIEAPTAADEPTSDEPAVGVESDGDTGANPSASGVSTRPDSFASLPRSIADALSLTVLPKLDELIRPLTECCARLEEAIGRLTTALEPIRDFTNALPGTVTTEEVAKQINRIEDEVRKATKPGILDEVSVIDMVAEWATEFLTGVAGLLRAPANLIGLWIGMQVAHLREVYRRLNADPSDLKNWSAERLEGLEQLSKRYPDSETGSEADSILAPWFAQAWSAWSLALRDLIGNIESPESDRLREESLRVLPDVVEDIERAMDLFQRQHPGQAPSLDRRLLERAIDLLRDNRPAFHESQYQDSGTLYSPASYSVEPANKGSDYDPSPAVSEIDELRSMMRTVLTRLLEPVRLEIRVLDDRVIARRLDGNRGVGVDFSRGPRLVGYISV